MTPLGHVIRAIYDDRAQLLVNVRADLNGWSVTVIDTRHDRILRRVTFASRQRALDFAYETLGMTAAN